MSLNVLRLNGNSSKDNANSNIRLYSSGAHEVRKSCSIVLQDNHLQLAGREDAASFLGTTGKPAELKQAGFTQSGNQTPVDETVERSVVSSSALDRSTSRTQESSKCEFLRRKKCFYV